MQESTDTRFNYIYFTMLDYFPNNQWYIDMDGITEAMNESISDVSATMCLSRKTKVSSVARILPVGY